MQRTSSNNMALNPITHPFRAAALASAVGLLIASGTVHAQATTGDSTMVKLIRGLIQSGALKKDVGEALLAQARAEAQATQQLQRQVAAQATAQPTQTAGGVKPEPGDVRVPYVPQTVRDQIRDEVKTEVLAQAKSERWAAPDSINTSRTCRGNLPGARAIRSRRIVNRLNAGRRSINDLAASSKRCCCSNVMAVSARSTLARRFTSTTTL